MILISDIHGCYKTLIKLLKKCPDEEIIFLGDLVDRGPRSKDVVQFAIDNNIKCVMGNHDHMMAFPNEIIGGKYYAGDIWHMNGAQSTIKSYNEDENLFNKHVEFIKTFPYYLEYEGLLLSHTGNGKIGLTVFQRIWARELLENFEDNNDFYVFGHTPNREPYITDRFANIDTGCAYKHSGYGKLTALHWPSKKIYQQEYCD